MARAANVLLALALIVVIGWPLTATLLTAFRGSEAGGAGLMSPAPSDVAAGRVARPLALARTTVALVLITEAIALTLGLPLALILFRTDAWGRQGVLALLIVSAFVPLPLHAAAWIGAFGNAGRMQALNTGPILVGLLGAAFVHAMAALPWVTLLAGVGLRTVEPELEEAALLDRPGWQVLGAITLRRGLGAIAGAALAVAVLTAGDMTVTDLLQVRTYAEEAYIQFAYRGSTAGAATALLPMVLLGALVAAAARGLLRFDPARLESAADRARVWRLGRWRIATGLAVGSVAGAIVALPLLTLIWRAGRVGGVAAAGRLPHWSLHGLVGTLRSAVLELADNAVIGPLRDALVKGSFSELRFGERWFGNPLASPLLASLAWAAAGSACAVLIAWSLAWLSRDPGPWRWVTGATVALALATPGPVAGMALVLGYRAVPWIYNSASIVVLAIVLRTLPYGLLVLWPAVRGTPQLWLESAAVDGYSPLGVVWRVALPATRGALIAAWAVAFTLGVGELPATNVVAPPGTPPLSVVIWGLLHTGVESHLAGVALILLAFIGLMGLFAATLLANVWPIPSRALPVFESRDGQMGS